jgi:hypothetical protein
VPALPSCIHDPLREQFLALLPVRDAVHPLGCHRPRIPDAVVFDRLVEALVVGAGYERIADAVCPGHDDAPKPGRVDRPGRQGVGAGEHRRARLLPRPSMRSRTSSRQIPSSDAFRWRVR